MAGVINDLMAAAEAVVAEIPGMSKRGGVLDLNPDGSLAFTIDGETVEWRYPKVKHLRAARNALVKLAEEARLVVADRDDENAELSDMLDDVHLLVGVWVRNVHDNIATSGSLPNDVDDWPAWLANMQFTAAVSEHWGTAPFG